MAFGGCVGFQYLVTKHCTVRTGPKYRSWVLVKCVWCGAYYWFWLRKGTGYGFHAFLTCILLLLLLIQCKIPLYLGPVRTVWPVRCFVTPVWLKSPPTLPSIISSPYQLNKQVEQSGEFISIKWMFTGDFSQTGTDVPPDSAKFTSHILTQLILHCCFGWRTLELNSWWTRKLISFWRPYRANICAVVTGSCSLKVR